MFEGLREFLVRHRRKFLVTGVLVGGVFITFKYAQRRLTEFQERKTRELLEATRRLQHFESTERTCNKVIIGMGTELYVAILGECNVEWLVERLRQKPENKVELWNEVRLLSFTRLAAYVYATSMLVIGLRVQLNLLGGYLYREATGTADEQTQISDELKQQYLSLIRYFFSDGMPKLVRMLRRKVNEVLQTIPLTEQLTLANVDQLCWSLQLAINGDVATDPNSRMCRYLLPPQCEGPALLQQMYNETLDLLESEDAVSVCSTNVSRQFSLVIDAIANSWKTPGQSSGDAANINNTKMPLARIIPIISGLTEKGFDASTNVAAPQNLATSLLTFLLINEKTKTLGANVYETFSSSKSVVS